MARPIQRLLVGSLAAVALNACGDDRPRTNPTRDGGVSTSDGGNTIRDSGVMSSTIGFAGPLLELPNRDTYRCATDRPSNVRAQELWTGYEYVATSDGSNWLVVVAGLRPDPFTPLDRFEVQMRPIAADGTAGTPVVVAADNGTERRELGAVAIADDLLVVWLEQNVLSATMVDTAGNVVSGPHVVASVGATARDVRLVAGASGALVAWSTIGTGDRVELHARALDATGAPAAPERTVSRSQQRFVRIVPEVVRDDDGYAVLYANGLTDEFSVEFRRLNATGEPRADAIVLSTTSSGFGFSDNRGSLLRLDDGFIAAWSELGVNENVDDEAWVMVHLARLDQDGRIMGEAVPLMAPELHVDHVEPALFWFDDQIALTWGRGDHIYICGGCFPNHSTKLVLIDPDRLVPSSAVATFDAPGAGLLGRRHHVIGDLVLNASRVVYHVHHDIQDGSFSCVLN